MQNYKKLQRYYRYTVPMLIDPVYRTLEIMQNNTHTNDTGKIEKSLLTVIKFDDLADVSSLEIKDIDEYLGIE